MDRKTVIRICQGCFEDPTGQIRAELARLSQHYGEQIEIVEESCLDVCENEPVIAVNDICLAPASPDRLRHTVEGQI